MLPQGQSQKTHQLRDVPAIDRKQYAVRLSRLIQLISLALGTVGWHQKSVLTVLTAWDKQLLFDCSAWPTCFFNSSIDWAEQRWHARPKCSINKGDISQEFSPF